MIGKFGERYAKQVNMAWMWARLHSRSTRSAISIGGFQAADNTAARLEELGAAIIYKTGAQIIEQTESGACCCAR